MRLINADALMLHLSNYALQESPNDNESIGERRISEMVYRVIQNCIEAVEKQPTAYNPEKVVEELERKKRTSVECLGERNGTGFNKVMDLAIDIVKRGGVE